MTLVKKEADLYCQSCNARLRLELSVTLLPHTAPPEEEKAVSLDSKKILVAVEGEVTHEMISEILSEAGFSVITASDGQQALELMWRHRPAVSIVDVGLPQVFESVIAETKKDDSLRELKVILLSSIHNKTKYKREPDSLYGAADYIERHHIQDQLLNKVMNLLKPQQPVSLLEQTEPGPVTVAQPEAEKQPAVTGDLAPHDAAKRLARIIISDIVLYNQKRVEEGLENDTFRELLRDELEEGLKLYRNRTAGEVLETTHYYEEAISDFIQQQEERSGR